MPKTYFTFISAVHLFLIKENRILLLRRFNTGYEDGNYSVPAGHIEADETATNAMIREIQEEIGIEIFSNKLNMIHVMHRKAEHERIDFFFESTEFTGIPQIMEPNKCDDLQWFDLDNLPKNTVAYVKSAIEVYRNKTTFSEFGWE